MDKAKLVCEYNRRTREHEIWLCALNMAQSYFIKNCDKGFQKLESRRIRVSHDGRNEQHAGVMNAFAAHILRSGPLVAEGKEGINGLTISNAAFLSSCLGGKEIVLPLDEDLYYEMLQEKIRTSRYKKNVKKQVETDMGSTY